jgi:LCP family protein required for cell wall assembly
MRSDSPSAAGTPPPTVSDGAPEPGAALPPLEHQRWQGPPRQPQHRAPRSRSPERAFLLLVIGVLVVFGGVAIAAATWTTKHLDGSVDRIAGVFPSGDRPAPAEAGLTMLLAGRDPIAGTNADGLADSLMLVHVSGGRTTAQVVYLPVHAQPVPGGPTLDQSFSQGGPAQLISAVEGLTGVRVDHYAEVDFSGFQTVTDAVGGVDVDVPAPYRNGAFDYPAGRQHLEGDAALAYVRDGPAQDEEGAVARQQAVISALFDRITEQGLLSDLGRISSTLGSVAEAVRVDDTLGDTELVQLAWSFRGLSHLDFVTAPLAGTTVQDGQPVAAFDPARAPALWGYLRDDVLGAHLAEFG